MLFYASRTRHHILDSPWSHCEPSALQDCWTARAKIGSVWDWWEHVSWHPNILGVPGVCAPGFRPLLWHGGSSDRLKSALQQEVRWKPSCRNVILKEFFEHDVSESLYGGRACDVMPCCKVRDPGHLTCDNEASVRGRTDKHPDKSKTYL